jgi:glycogen debranching enzyme
VHVAIASRHATKIELCLFDESGEIETHRIALTHRSGDVHHSTISNVPLGTRYGFRVDGPWQPTIGHRFDATKLLVDPHATQLDGPYQFHLALCEPGRDTAPLVPKAIVSTPLPIVKRPKPHHPKWIYELPVRAFTMRHPDVPLAKRCTISALTEPAILKHFKTLGVDTIELMPLVAWIDERHLHALGLRNVWGYNPVNFMAPDSRIAPGGFTEIAKTVATLHDHGFQVILDVVLNHTGESDASGPTLSLRGFDNLTYYRHINGMPINDTGCGNTLALDDPIVCDYALSALRHWVEVTGVDGFRFDLATIMGRTQTGFKSDSPLITAINADPILKDCILIAEPWDIGPGGYQLGQFPKQWPEWNDRYRDDVRRFWRGDEWSANAFATRLTGSSDQFAPHKLPAHSINFIAAHDGFTLRDLTLFTSKHNLANGEGNRDGKNDEVTWPNGSVATFLATLFFSRGTPMLTAGDEFGRTQHGNNNAYAQDNETTWLDWEHFDSNSFNTCAELIALRNKTPLLHAQQFLNGMGTPPDAQWFGSDGEAPDWNNKSLRTLGLILSDSNSSVTLIINGTNQPIKPIFPSKLKCTWQGTFGLMPNGEVPAQSIALFRKAK